MNDLTTYHVKIRGQISAGDINVSSPVHLTVIQSAAALTLLSACTDQSGLVGLLRYLHNLGYIFLSVQRID